LGFDADRTAPDAGILEDGISHIYKSGVFRKTACHIRVLRAVLRIKAKSAARLPFRVKIVSAEQSAAVLMHGRSAAVSGPAAEEHLAGLIVDGDALSAAQHDRMPALAARYRIPLTYPADYFGDAGRPDELLRQPFQVGSAGRHLSRVHSQRRQALQPTRAPTDKVVINMKTAKSPGLTVPLTLQVAADRVIE
jgi:hypothetical protein